MLICLPPAGGFMVMKNRITMNASDTYCPAFGGHGVLVSQEDIR
jgi:hypothetical protein